MLVREAQRGDRAAFEELVRHYDQAVLRLALHLTGSEHEAQDIYQDAFLKAYKSIGRFRFECSFYTWIYRIVTNFVSTRFAASKCGKKTRRWRWIPKASSLTCWRRWRTGGVGRIPSAI